MTFWVLSTTFLFVGTKTINRFVRFSCYTFLMRYFLFVFTCSVYGCSSVATFPPVETATFLSTPSAANEPVPTIMSKVILYSHEHYGGMDSIVFNLPGGVDQKTYSLVEDIVVGAVPMASQNEISYHIVELRVRGFTADADVVFPSASGSYGMATIHLKSSIVGPWEVVGDRVWLIPIESPPLPTFVEETEVVEIETSSSDN